MIYTFSKKGKKIGIKYNCCFTFSPSKNSCTKYCFNVYFMAYIYFFYKNDIRKVRQLKIKLINTASIKVKRKKHLKRRGRHNRVSVLFYYIRLSFSVVCKKFLQLKFLTQDYASDTNSWFRLYQICTTILRSVLTIATSSLKVLYCVRL